MALQLKELGLLVSLPAVSKGFAGVDGVAGLEVEGRNYSSCLGIAVASQV